MNEAPTPQPEPDRHRSLRLAAVFGLIVLVMLLGAYSFTQYYGSGHSSSGSGAQNRTVVIYDNRTVFQNTTHNVTTPIFHNTTMWHNSTVYQNGTVYQTTTVYVNTTKVVMIPVVNVTGFRWGFNSTGAFTGKIGANLVTPSELGFNHSYPLGTVMWIVMNVSNYASSGGQLSIHLGSPFVLIDSQPSVPHWIGALSTVTIEVSIGVPYAPGQYTLGMTVTVS